jgi:hypothetical protein
MAELSTGGSTGSRTARPSTSAERNGTEAAAIEVTTIAMTPDAALARHIEWLDFALDAATAEEGWRRERLAKASKGNRAKRTNRLAEVTAEIEELTALLAGIRQLQARAAGAVVTPTVPRRRGRPPGSKNKPKPTLSVGAAGQADVAAPSANVTRTAMGPAATAARGSMNGASATRAPGRGSTPRPRERRSNATSTSG